MRLVDKASPLWPVPDGASDVSNNASKNFLTNFTSRHEKLEVYRPFPEGHAECGQIVQTNEAWVLMYRRRGAQEARSGAAMPHMRAGTCVGCMQCPCRVVKLMTYRGSLQGGSDGARPYALCGPLPAAAARAAEPRAPADEHRMRNRLHRKATAFSHSTRSCSGTNCWEMKEASGHSRQPRCCTPAKSWRSLSLRRTTTSNRWAWRPGQGQAEVCTRPRPQACGAARPFQGRDGQENDNQCPPGAPLLEAARAKAKEVVLCRRIPVGLPGWLKHRAARHRRAAPTHRVPAQPRPSTTLAMKARNSPLQSGPNVSWSTSTFFALRGGRQAQTPGWSSEPWAASRLQSWRKATSLGQPPAVQLPCLPLQTVYSAPQCIGDL